MIAVTILRQKEEWVITLKSIRQRLLLGFTIIEVLLLLAVFGLNYFFATDFYITNNNRILNKYIGEGIELYYPNDIPELNNYIALNTGANSQIISSKIPDQVLFGPGRIAPENVDPLIIDKNDPTQIYGDENLEETNTIDNKKPIFDSTRRDSLFINMKTLIDNANKLDGETYTMVTLGETNKNRFILSATKLGDDAYLITESGLGIVDSSFIIFTSFLLISLSLVFVLAFIAIWFYATTFTNPLKKLSLKTKKVSKLDFSGEPLVPSHRGDEIDMLINSVNAMEKELAASIKELRYSNHLLEQELAKEKDLDNLRNRFLSDVSHELKNPLSIISGYSEALDKGIIKNDEDKLYYINVIHSETIRMNRLVKDLLNLSRLSAPGFKVEKEPCDLVNLIHETFYNYKKAFKDKECTVEWNIPDELILNLDPIRFSQILTNLFDNALKHVEQKGRIQISLEKGEREDGFNLEIGNTGDLIPEDEQSRIWEGFYQVDTDTNGSGLGLTIVKKLVALHDASISLWVDDMNRFRIKR